VAPGTGAGAQVDDLGPRPEVFSSAASSRAVTLFFDRPGLLPVEDLFRIIALDGEALYQSSVQRARTSLLFPGQGLVVGPSLACSQVPADKVPAFFLPVLAACLAYQFPLSVQADGLNPDASTEGRVALGTASDPVSAVAVGGLAHAGPDASTTQAVIEDFRAVGLPAFGPLSVPVPGFEGLDSTLLTIQSATSTTDQRIVEGDLVSTSEVVLSGVRLIGGLVDIGSIVSRSTVVDRDDGETTSDATFEVTGVEVAGTPAQITDEGLVLGQPAGDLGPLRERAASAIADFVDQFDITFDQLEVLHGVDEQGFAFAQAEGLLVSVDVPVSTLPPLGQVDLNGVYTLSVQLGTTGARGIASSFDDALPPILRPSTGSPSPVVSGAGFASAPTPAAAAAPVAAPPAAAATPEEPLIERVRDLLPGRIELLYAAFTLAALALCLAPRWATPARLPGTRA
jgi:hypothetical protein